MKSAFVVGAVFLFAMQAHAAVVYKWTDANGKVHYTDQPPAGKVGESPMKIQVQSGVQEVSKKAVDDSSKNSKLNAESQAPKKTNAENCKIAKSNLVALQNPAPAYKQGEKGERILLDKEQRQKEIESANEAVKNFCEPS